jgi:hypothetical protein
LLGERQLAFLRDWAADWRGADMKAVISQTVFTAMATTHGPRHERLRADYDTNAWPQSARNAALREIRKAFAFHIAGDQHLPAVVHYGIDAHRDAGLAFAGPAVNNLYPRWWEPGPANRPDAAGGDGGPLGDFRDSFGHPLTVRAVANPARTFRKGVLEAEQDKAAGLAVVRFDKAAREIIVECWPFLADPAGPGTQFPGWPVRVSQVENYARAAVAHLPTLEVRGVEAPVIRVADEQAGETVYTLRVGGPRFRPFVFAEGRYRVTVSDPETGRFEGTARPRRPRGGHRNPGRNPLRWRDDLSSAASPMRSPLLAVAGDLGGRKLGVGPRVASSIAPILGPQRATAGSYSTQFVRTSRAVGTSQVCGASRPGAAGKTCSARWCPSESVQSNVTRAGSFRGIS